MPEIIFETDIDDTSELWDELAQAEEEANPPAPLVTPTVRVTFTASHESLTFPR